MHDAGKAGKNRTEHRGDRHVGKVEAPEDYAAGRAQRSADRNVQRLPFQRRYGDWTFGKSMDIDGFGHGNLLALRAAHSNRIGGVP